MGVTSGSLLLLFKFFSLYYISIKQFIIEVEIPMELVRQLEAHPSALKNHFIDSRLPELDSPLNLGLEKLVEY